MAIKKNSFIVQGSILAVAGILVRIIGLAYRVPLTNILGDTGVGLYSTAFTVYSLLLMISSLSLPLAVSKLVAQRAAKKEYKNMNRLFIGALIFALIAGIITGSIMYFFSNQLASLMGFSKSAFAMKVLSPTLFVVSIIGVFRGFFQGIGSTMPTAFSQIIEQIINAVVSIYAAIYLKNLASSKDAASYGAAGGTIGTGAGAFAALIFLIFLYLVYRTEFKKKIKKDKNKNIIDYKNVSIIIVATIIPVLISTTIYNVSNMLDNAIFGRVMAFMGESQDKYAAFWGIYSNKYYVLITLPIAIASAYAPSMVISLIKSLEQERKGAIIAKIDSFIRFVMLLAIPCAVGLSVLASPILMMLFKKGDNFEIGVNLVRFSIITVVASSLFTATNAILQGLDKIKIPMKNALVALAFHIPILVILLLLFKLNIYAVVIADIIFVLMCLFMNYRAIYKVIGYKQELKKTFILPFVASVFMGGAAYATYYIINVLTKHNSIGLIISILIAIFVYFIFLVLTKAVTREDLYQLPKGEKLVKIAKAIHLL